jgi:hypothetical protein
MSSVYGLEWILFSCEPYAGIVSIYKIRYEHRLLYSLSQPDNNSSCSPVDLLHNLHLLTSLLDILLVDADCISPEERSAGHHPRQIFGPARQGCFAWRLGP